MTVTSKASKAMSAAERFFWEQAGFSWDPQHESKAQGRRRCAREMARAEQWAEAEGYTFQWEPEQWPDLSWMDAEERAREHEVLCCLMRSGPDGEGEGEVLQSLGNIVDADRKYMRVVQAELALEQLCEVEREAREAREVYQYCAL